MAALHGLIAVAFLVTLLVGVFCIFRGFWLWYWKINRIEQLLQEQVEELRALRALQTPVRKVA